MNRNCLALNCASHPGATAFFTVHTQGFGKVSPKISTVEVF